MICAHNNIMAHYLTMDIQSDVLMGHGTKSSAHYMIPTKSSAQNGISTGDLGIYSFQNRP